MAVLCTCSRTLKLTRFKPGRLSRGHLGQILVRAARFDAVRQVFNTDWNCRKLTNYSNGLVQTHVELTVATQKISDLSYATAPLICGWHLCVLRLVAPPVMPELHRRRRTNAQIFLLLGYLVAKVKARTFLFPPMRHNSTQVRELVSTVWQFSSSHAILACI